MHKPDYSQTLRWRKDGSFFFETTASWKGLRATVLRIGESGRTECRYLYYCGLAGYLVCFPGEKANFYYGYDETQKSERFRKWEGSHGLCVPWADEERDLKEIAARRPDLKYLCAKFSGGTASDFVKTVVAYKSHPEIEPLVQLGMQSLVTNKNFWRMKDETRESLCRWIRRRLPELRAASALRKPWLPESSIGGDFALCEILRFKKDGRDVREQVACDMCDLTHDQYRYTVRKSVEPSDYDNYLKAVRLVGHDDTDGYWAFPNDFQKSFDKVSREKSAMDKAEELRKNDVFGDGIRAFAGISEKTKRRINGLTVYIPFSVDDIADQAKALDQCLVRNGYIEKMADLQSVLVFVKDGNGKPVATAEIGWDRKLIQMYGHEFTEDREMSKASPEAAYAVSEFLSSLRIRKPKHRLPKLEGDDLFFKGVSDKMTDMYGKNLYEVGKTFDTGCPDSDFGPECVSTDKAIHFCRDIHEINKSGNYSGASKYLIVKALGKVFEAGGGAFISNRIKVVSVVNV